MKFVSRVLLSLLVTCMMFFSSAYAEGGNSQGGIVKPFGDIYVNEGVTVEGDAVTVKGNIYINGTVTGSAVTVFGKIIVNGKVLGDAVSATGSVTVGENGRVMGNTVEGLGGNRNPGSGGYIPHINVRPWPKAADILFSFFTSLGIFLLGALIYLIMPGKTEEMAETIEPNLGRRMGIGILAIFGSPIAMIILTIVLAVTIIGILVIPFAWIAYFIAIFIGVVPVYVYLGRKISGAMSKPASSGYSALAWGVLTLWIIKVVSSFGGFYTGWINWIISFGIYVLGIGTLLDYIFSSRDRNRAYNPYQTYQGPQGDSQWTQGEYNQPYQNYTGNYVPEERESKTRSDDFEQYKGEENKEE